MPREQLYDRKVPVMLTDAQLEWLDEWRFSRRFENRSEAIRALIDREREAQPEVSPLPEPAEVALPDWKPYDPIDFPGQGWAPLLVPFIVKAKRHAYTDEELAEVARLNHRSMEKGQRVSIANTMKTLGFRPYVKRLPGKPRLTGWEYV